MFMFSRHSKLAAPFDSFPLALSALSVPAMAKKLSKQISLWSLKEYAKMHYATLPKLQDTQKTTAPGRQLLPSKQDDSTVSVS